MDVQHFFGGRVQLQDKFNFVHPDDKSYMKQLVDAGENFVDIMWRQVLVADVCRFFFFVYHRSRWH